MPDTNDTRDADNFVRDFIDTVPHLEALLQLWNTRPHAWSIDEMAKVLYIGAGHAGDILNDLVRRRLAARASEGFCYQPEPMLDRRVANVEATYRRELVRLSKLIHSKPSAAVREFARAFRFKKEERD